MNLAFYLKHYHLATEDDFVPSKIPGCWERKEVCGHRGKCPSVAAHQCWGWEGLIKHTIFYTDPDVRDASGRFLSPHRTWRAAVERVNEAKSVSA